MSKKRVIVVMGGPSEEHQVSLKTGLEVLHNIDRERYDVSIVVIDKQKKFYFAKNSEFVNLEELQAPEVAERFRGPYAPQGAVSIWGDCDIAFLALHGEFGEDGKFQGYLETIGIPYTGCDVFASAVGMHKTAAKKIFEASGIPTAPYSVYRGTENIKNIAARHGFPCFVKCPQSGSSKLLGRADTFEQLEHLLATFIKESKSVLVETMIDGDEFSCPVLEEEDGSLRVLNPVYIKPEEGKFFDFEAKYEGKSQEIVPAPHPAEIQETIKKTALAVHKVLECRGLSRTDVIVKDEVAYVLEVNTLPGFTGQSLFPQSYASEGGEFKDLISTIIENGLKAK